MADSDESVSIWYRRGRYVLGREGYRPFLSLPENKAKKVLSGTTSAERLSFGTLLLSGLVIGAQALGAPIPIAVDAILFILEFSLITLASTIVAKTVIKRESTRASDATDFEVSGLGNSPELINRNALRIEAGVSQSHLNILFSHARTDIVDIRLIDAWSESGNLKLRDTEELSSGISVEPSFITEDTLFSRSKTEYNFEVISTAESNGIIEDTLYIELGMKSQIESNERVEKLSIPVIIETSGEVESEEVVEVTFERLTD